MPDELRPADIADGLTTALRDVVGEDITVVLEPGGEDVAVVIDRGDLEQILIALAVQAQHRMPDGGTLRIGVRETSCGLRTEVSLAKESGRWVEISVADDGNGLDVDALSDCLSTQSANAAADPHRAVAPADPPGRGEHRRLVDLTGVTYLARRYRGDVGVVSGPGMGTTVLVVLPRAEQPSRLPQQRRP